MGNVRSAFLCREDTVDWNSYVVENWRSARTRDLDSLGGLERPAIARGDSMTARLEFLQVSLQKQGQEMEVALFKSPPRKADKQAAHKHLLRTEIRALEREQGAAGGQDDDTQIPLSWTEQQERSRQMKQAARSKMIEYAKKAQAEVQLGVQSHPGRPAKSLRRSSNLEDVRLSGSSTHAGDEQQAESAQHQKVAEWRRRVHAARRRMILVVLTVVRLKQGRNHPRRMQRIDSFSYSIPMALKSEYPRFVEELTRYAAVVANVKSCQSDLDLVLQTAFRQGLQQASGQTTQPPLLTSGAAPLRSQRPPTGILRAPATGFGRALKMSARVRSASESSPSPSPHGPDGKPSAQSWGGSHDAEAVISSGPSMTSVVEKVRDSEKPRPVSGPWARALNRPPDNRLPAISGRVVDVFAFGAKPQRSSPSTAAVAEHTDADGAGAADAATASSPRPDGPARDGSFSFPRSNSTGQARARELEGENSGCQLGGRSGKPRLSLPLPGERRDIEHSGRTPSRPLSPARDRSASDSGLLEPPSPGVVEHLEAVPELLTHLSSPISGLGQGGGKERPSRITSASTSTSSGGGSGSSGGGAKLRCTSTTDVLVERTKVEALTHRIEEEASRRSHCERMLGMYINRSNAAWAESQGGWAPATAVEQQELQDGEDMHIYKAELIRKLRLGQIVFQVFAAEDELALPEGGSLDLWTSDPWALVAAARPGSMPISGERMEGLSMGGRALTQLRMAVEEVAGSDAAAALTVVLHLHEGQREAVLKDLCNRRHYGFRPDNLFVTVQQRRPAYRYDPCENHFTPDDADACDKPTHFSMGPGFGMLQLGWVADAFTLSDSGTCVALKETLLEHLQRRNVEWLISRRSCDLSLYSAEGALDVASLTQVLQLRQYARATAVSQVIATPSMTTMRQMDSLFVCRQSSANEAILISPFKHSKPVHTVTELRCCECSSAVMVDALSQVKADAGGELLAGLHRYAFHFPTLATILTNPKVFRPKLALEGTAVRIHLELSDLTSHPSSKCLAIHAPLGHTGLLMSPKEVQDLIPLIQSQDYNPEFRGVAGCTAVASAMLAASTAVASASGALSRVAAGHRIVVFCADNDVTHTAIDFVATFARAGSDEVFLCTVVPSQLHQSQGNALLIRFSRQLASHMIKCKMSVVIKGYAGLLDSMESYATSCDASLVVMGSQAIVSHPLFTSGQPSAASLVGSVTLSLLKRLRLPMALVTSQTRLQPSTERLSSSRARPQGPRVLAVVEPHARPMLNYLCSNCLDPLRGDRLVLGQPLPSRCLTSQQQMTARRLMNDFTEVAAGHHLAAARMPLEGQLERALCQAAESDGLQLIALHLKRGDKGVPPEVLNLVRSSRAAVLLYRDIITASD